MPSVSQMAFPVETVDDDESERLPWLFMPIPDGDDVENLPTLAQ
jgi:hypothetical protein